MRLGKRVGNFFEKLSSHFTTEDLRAVWAKKRKTFFEKFSVPTTYWRSNPGLAETFDFFLSSLATGHEKCVWAKKSETFLSFFCSHFPLEAGGPSGPIFRHFFFLTYMGKMSTPSLPLPTGGKAVD